MATAAPTIVRRLFDLGDVADNNELDEGFSDLDPVALLNGKIATLEQDQIPGVLVMIESLSTQSSTKQQAQTLMDSLKEKMSLEGFEFNDRTNRISQRILGHINN